MSAAETPAYGVAPQRADVRPQAAARTRVALAWLVGAVAILVTAAILPGLDVGGFWQALGVAALIAVINAILPPVIAALRLPYTVALAFLLVLLANAVALLLVGRLDGGLEVDGFGWALLASLVIAAVTTDPAGDPGHERRRRLLAPRRPPSRRGSRPTGSRPRCRGSSTSRSTGSRNRCSSARCATATRRTWRAGSQRRRTASSSGRPISPRRRVRARRGSCSARTRTSRPSAGSRRSGWS